MAELSTVKSNLGIMVSKGASMQEIDTYVASTGFNADQIREFKPQAVTQPDEPFLERGTRETISEFARPALELGGLTAGSIVGAVGGVGVASPLLAVAGAALGFSAGANVADRLDEFLGLTKRAGLKESSIKALSDVEHGAILEMGGGIAGKAITAGGVGVWHLAEKMGLLGLFKRIKGWFPSMSEPGMLNKAKEVLEKVRKETPRTGEALKESTGIVERAGIETPLTFAQRTGSSEAAFFEQSTAAKNAELGAILRGQDAQINREAIDYIQRQFPRKGTVGDTIAALEKQEGRLLTTSEKTAEIARAELSPIQLGKRPQEVGSVIKQELETGKQIAKKEVDNLYNQIPQGIELGPAPLTTKISDIKADFKRIGGGPDSLPSPILKQMQDTLKASEGKSVTMENLRDWRSQITTEIRDQFQSRTPNLKLVRRLKTLENGVDDALDQMLELSPQFAETIELYRKASVQFKDFVKTFRSGRVGDVLAKGGESTGGKVPLSDIPSRFFRTGKMDAADDLVRAVGKEKAATVIDDYAGFEFVSSVAKEGTVNVKQGLAWINKNRDVLNKFGLTKKYSDIVRSQTIADDAFIGLETFRKSVASRVLGADSGKVIKNIFTGAGKTQSKKFAEDLMNLPGVKDNPLAVQGIQNSFKDFTLSTIEKSGVDALGNPLRSVAKIKKVIDDLRPAMEVIYKNEPKKIQALFDYHKILEFLARNKNVSFAGGSTTVEKAVGVRRETVDTIARNIAQLAAIQRGKGFMFGAIKNIWNSITTAPRKFSEEQINKYLTEAIYNPELAKTIMDSAAPFVSKKIQGKFTKQLLSMGIFAAEEVKEAVTEPIREE